MADNSTDIVSGLYDDYKDAFDSAYAKGYADGAAGGGGTNVEVTYHITHTHGDYCYPAASYTTSTRTRSGVKTDYEINGTWYTWYPDYFDVTYTCTNCGRSFTGTACTSDYRDNANNAYTRALNSYNAHLVNARCRVNGYTCGKEEGEQDITDVSVLGAGDSVISATIVY